MARVEKSSRAEADLAAIADFIAVDNLDAALQWSDDIHRTFQLLARNPLLGEDIASLQPGTRRQVFGNYLIFYRPTATDIVIVRVLHGSRKIDNLRDGTIKIPGLRPGRCLALFRDLGPHRALPTSFLFSRIVGGSRRLICYIGAEWLSSIHSR